MGTVSEHHSTKWGPVLSSCFCWLLWAKCYWGLISSSWTRSRPGLLHCCPVWSMLWLSELSGQVLAVLYHFIADLWWGCTNVWLLQSNLRVTSGSSAGGLYCKQTMRGHGQWITFIILVETEWSQVIFDGCILLLRLFSPDYRPRSVWYLCFGSFRYWSDLCRTSSTT